jgi:D-glycero-D-manno-heptose 1,7-bisphosphate phosphatase
VLNAMVVDAEHGTVDSPLYPAQVAILPGVPEALARLTQAGYGLAIVSNQPSAAKGKTTRQNLDQVLSRVIDLAQSAGGIILSTHICYHRGEDGCLCRKPKTGLLEEAFKRHATYDRKTSWMVGDGVIDIQAGQAMGLQTAMVAKHKADTAALLKEKNAVPTLWVDDLPDFARQILK